MKKSLLSFQVLLTKYKADLQFFSLNAAKMAQEKFNLTWHSYSDHLIEMLHNMMRSNERGH